MIDPGSLVGFALALVATSWLSSAAFCGAILSARPWLRRRGPAAERAAASAALWLGPLSGLAIVATLAARSLWVGGADHCGLHGHHPHLCLAHGGAWASEPWAVVATAAIGAWIATRLAQKVAGLVRARRAVRQVEEVSVPTSEGALLAPARTAFCFVVGFARPRVIVSSAAWAALDQDERRAVLAHERAHIARGDLLRRALLGLVALAGAPVFAARVLRWWGDATERACDLDAARAVEPTAVARALVALARLGATRAPAGLSFGSEAGVVARVEALLRGGETGDATAGRVVRGAWGLFLVIAVGAATFADPLHHLLETLLGAL